MTNDIKNQYYYWQDSYFDKRVKKRRRRRKSIISNLLNTLLYFNYLKILFTILICLLVLNEMSLNVNCQEQEIEFDAPTTLRPNKMRPSRPTRTRSTSPATNTTTIASTTTTITTTKPAQQTLAPKTTQSSLTSTTVSSSSSSHHHHTSTAPYHYAPESLNKTHANLFKNWLDVKSNELYQLSMNYSGYKLLNKTYNLQLREDAKFSWINFTEMIMEISNTISEVLYNKTLIVKNLSEAVEDAFDKYRNDTRRVKESANHIYYDTKSPKTFCDVQEIHNQRAAKQANLTATTEATTKDSINTQTSIPLFSSSSAPTNLDGRTNSLLGDNIESTTPNIDLMKNISNDLKFFNRKSNFIIDDDYNLNYDSLEFDFIEKPKKLNSINKLNKRSLLSAKDYDDNYDESCENTFPYFLNSITSAIKPRVKRQNPVTPPTGQGGRQRGSNRPKPNQSRQPGGGGSSGGGGGGGGGIGPAVPGVPSVNATKRIKPTKPTKPKQPITPPSSQVIYDDMEERTDLEAYDDYSLITAGDKSPFWNVTCINRTFDENFKNFQKGVNRNVSTVHVPINVYKQDIEINMTAYWTEALNDQFRKNYDSDNELFWQYFCSSNGLFRRYPGAYWTVPAREDFFDCRLQSWYIMAAASPKDVLVLLDSSGSMTGSRLEIAKKLIESIMDTLSDNDFFNVLTFSNKVDYLMNLQNETEYRGRFVQAGKTNKLRFVEKLKYFKNTSNIANFEIALVAAFKLLLSNRLKSDSCGCNKVIMIITDGASENAEAIFKKYNWENGRKVRVFTFLIGRDIVDTRHIKWMACANDGQFFHVGTIADVNEHVHEYIPVLSRPMALSGLHETTWSNVFIGHMDKELKIAVARPAFQRTETLLAHYGSSKKHKMPHDPNRKKLKPLTTTTTTTTTEAPELLENDNIDYYEYQNEYDEYDYGQIDEPKETPDIEIDEELQERIDETLDNQQVLLGVVGVDVPVLRLISKVSPKYQMGVGIYIMMIDNNGFIVFHPSIRRELQNAATDSKGTSASIDIEKFEIPVGNEAEYEQLEHDMIDEITGNVTLENWKREGMRVTRRRTEYVYTSVANTPFSVAIASPSSFGRFYIDLPPVRDAEYESELKLLVKNRYESAIQLYNCSYNFTRLTEKILNPKLYSDYCIRYLFTDKDQVRSIKSDLLIHDIYYNNFNFSIFAAHPNLVRSSFYGTFSGITFYLPVTFWRYKYPIGAKTKPKIASNTTTSTSSISRTTTQSTTFTIDLRFMDGTFTEPQSEMTVDVLGSILEPKTSSAPTPNPGRSITGGPIPDPTNETFIASLNLFSNEGNKHTYSFEKEYYTRTIEFSDFLRSKNNYYEPVVTYFLNETSKEARKETVSATLPIWLDKIPAAVTGAVYDAVLLRKFLFENYFNPPCHHSTCRNVCSEKRGMNVTCYLIDEYGTVVMSTVERLKGVKEPVMGQSLYKVNPWLMKSLEFEGIFNLIISGARLPECRKASTIVSSASQLLSLINLVIKTVIITLADLFKYILFYFIYSFGFTSFFTDFNIMNTNTAMLVSAQHARHPTVAERIETFNTKWRSDNSHCYYFGIYSFNITRWKELDASEFRIWCNSTPSGGVRKYLAGYVKHSNLLMLVVEDEFELYHCGNISSFINSRSPSPALKENVTNMTDSESTSDSSSAHGGGGNNKEEILDISKYHLMSNEYDAMLLLNDSSLMLDFNSSNVSFITDYKLNIKTHINRYRKKPDSCHNFFENERDYLPCHNSRASRLVNNNNSNNQACLISILLTILLIFN